jgi:DNA-binding transcriptional LysR family regulator
VGAARLADYSSLEQQLSELRDGLTGQIRIGAIPVSLPVTAPFADRHPNIRLRVISQTSIEIQRGLDEFTLDAGITYLDNERLDNVLTQPLYRARYVLVTHSRDSLQVKHCITWAEAARLPLCLLTPECKTAAS